MVTNVFLTKTIYGTLILLLFPVYLAGQIEYPGSPLAEDLFRKKAITYTVLPDAAILFKTSAGERISMEPFKADIFASVIRLDICPGNEGNWDRSADGLWIWRMGFTAPNASSLGLTLHPYRLQPGVRVFIYTPDRKTILGAYTFRNNKKSGILPLTSVQGDSIVVEIHSIRDPMSLGELELATASIGFPAPIPQKDGYYGWSAECNLDVNCLDITRYQVQKLSVCRLVTEEGSVRKRCTGTLINNTAEDGKAFVLTARHCVGSEEAANQTIFSFDYESPYCEGPDGELKSISGGYLHSAGENMDYVLLEMSEKPPVDYTPVYAGWNAGDEAPEATYIIHHPEGDVKKISYDTDPPTTTSFGAYEDETFWLVESYEEGSTENGSSGAALFNSSNQLVGTLTGGGTVCSDPINDCYQQFKAAWDASDESGHRLKYWLDPQNTGKTVLDNLDIYAGVAVALSNLNDDAELFLPPLVAGWGYASGHNSFGSLEFAEYFGHAGTKYVYALDMSVARAFYHTENKRIADHDKATDDASALRIKLWEGGSEPGDLLYEKDIFSFELEPGTDNFIRLDTLIQVNNGFFAGYEIFYGDEVDTFALYTGLPDNPLEIPARMNAGQGWQSLNDGTKDLSLSLAIRALVLDYYPQPGVGSGDFPSEEITIYPNPASDILQILFKEQPEDGVTITLFDAYGNFIHRQTYPLSPANIHFECDKWIGSGIYFLKIDNGDHTEVKKFIKL